MKDVKDKLEIGLKPDAPYRPTNLPESELNDEQEREHRERQRKATAPDERPHGDPLRKPLADSDS